MEIEIVVRMEANTEDFEIAEKAIKQHFLERTILKQLIVDKGEVKRISFRRFHFMAAQPIE